MIRKIFVLVLAMFSFLNVVAQEDSDGYTDITRSLRSGGLLRIIKTPSVNINNKIIANDGDNSNVALSYYNQLSSIILNSGDKAEIYGICFSIENSNSFHIVKNGRLLIKLGNEKTITLNASHDCDAAIQKDGIYRAEVEYTITTKQLNTIIKQNVNKFRIETIMGRYIDIEPDFNVSEITEKYKMELYSRQKTKRDSFVDNF